MATMCVSLLMDRLVQAKRNYFYWCNFIHIWFRFTMTGPTDKPGILPRATYQLFETAAREAARYKFNIKCYMTELYNDKLIDLLADNPHDKNAPKLAIKKDARVTTTLSNAH
jgi:hypothetical protein